MIGDRGRSTVQLGDVLLISGSGVRNLDTNALLDLCRVGKGQRDQTLSVLRDNSDGLFIPYQSRIQIQRNRPAVVAGMDRVYKNLLKVLHSINLY